MKTTLLLATALVATSAMAQTPFYSNDFETGTIGTGCSQVGSGEVVKMVDTKFNYVYHNMPADGSIRSNYLLLPNGVLNNDDVKTNLALTIQLWVNVANAENYWFSPLFAAYGAAPANGVNTFPMMAIQSRLLTQINCWGWCDFTASDNVTGTNFESTAWLDDKEWHLVTATYTPTDTKIYMDTELKNHWTTDGSEGHYVQGLLEHPDLIPYVCVSGNQAWDWGDNDPTYYIDDIALYAEVLTEDQIKTIYDKKKSSTGIGTATAASEVIRTEYFGIDGTKLGESYNALPAGVYVVRTTRADQSRETCKIVKR